VGGRGSGRHPGFPTTLDAYQAVDLRYLRRHGLLQPGCWGSLRWSRAGRETASIRFAVSQDLVTLAYRVRDRDTGDWSEITEPIRLLRTVQPLGGERLWLACPRCGKRCAVLYGGRRFFCRRCVGVPYASQNEAMHDRLLRRAQTIRERLGGSAYASLGMPFPPKPKRMHWTTYRRLRDVSERCYRGSLLAAARRFGLLPDELDDMAMD
jgi:hypothetical protein